MDEKIIGLDKNKDIDRRLEETTKQLQREREKLMAVIRMSGDLIFEYDIAKDQMHYAGPEEGSIRPVPICLVKMMLEASIEQFFQRDILSRNQLTYADALKEVVEILMYGIVQRSE